MSSLLFYCQALANLCNGYLTLTEGSYRPAFVRKSRSLKSVHANGFWALQDHESFINWIPREFNRPSDHSANIGLDSCDSDCWKDCRILWAHVEKIIITCDGDFRGPSVVSAAAWIVWGDDCHSRHLDVLAYGIQFWMQGRSAFEAEVVALESAMAFIARKF